MDAQDSARIVWSTFFGGNNFEFIRGLSLNDIQDVYICGQTTSDNFPTSSGCYSNSYIKNYDMFVSKISSDGKSLLFSTYIGSKGNDNALNIKLDKSSNIYICGQADSSDFPTSASAYSRKITGTGGDAVVLSLFPDGSNLIASSFLGAKEDDAALGLVIDSITNLTYGGWTYSSDFPTKPGAYQVNNYGWANCFITKMNNSMSNLIFSTFIGGFSSDAMNSLASDSSGNFYFTGFASSANYPTTFNAFSKTKNTGRDCFLTELNNSGSSLIYSTFIGGNNDEYGNSINFNTNPYICGYTYSNNFPSAAGAYQKSFKGGLYDIFVSSFNCNSGSLLASSYIGGINSEYASSIDFDDDKNILISGVSWSPDYPISTKSFQKNLAGGGDAIISKFNPDLSALDYSMWMGGIVAESFNQIKYQNKSIFCAGYSWSYNFLVSAGALDTSYNSSNGSNDGIIVCLTFEPEFFIKSKYKGSACAGGSFYLNYIANGNFKLGNTFFAQLSDSDGSFTAPEIIGSNNSTNLKDSILVNIPDNTVPGTNYRIRICSSDTSITGADNGYDIEIYQKPNILSDSIQYICSGDSVQIKTTTINGKSPYKYQWSPSAGLSDPNSANPWVKIDSSASYVITAIDMNSCLNSSTINIKVDYPEKPTLEIKNIPRACQTDSMIIHSTNKYSSYHWYYENSVSIGTDSICSANQSGKYYLVSTNSNGCKSVSDTLSINIDSNKYSIELISSLNKDGQFSFDTCHYPKIVYKYLKFNNSSKINDTIYDAYLQKNLLFSVPPYQFPLPIANGEQINLTVSFNPLLQGIFYDTLLVNSLCPTKIPLIAVSEYDQINGKTNCDLYFNINIIKISEIKSLISTSPYPNPASNLINIDYISKKIPFDDLLNNIEIRNILGERINLPIDHILNDLNNDFTQGKIIMNTEYLVSGNYLLKFNNKIYGIYIIK